MKKKYLKWIGCGFAGIVVLIVIAAAAFYLFELKPRIDVVMTVGTAFADSAGDGDILELHLADGQQVLLDISSDMRLDGVVHMEDAVYDGLEFGYLEEGIWVRFPDVSGSFYLLPWTDDVQEQISESALVSLLRLDEEQKNGLGEGMLELRRRILEQEDEHFTPTWLNRLLGLECLRADILDLYKGISFCREGTQEISRNGETLSCKKYSISIPEHYARLLLKTEGAGKFLETLGDVLGDISLDVYICKGELVRIDVDTSFLYMPQLRMADVMSLDIEKILENMSFTAAPLKGQITVGENGIMEAQAQLFSGDLSLETALTWRLLDMEASWRYDPDDALNIFQAGSFRLLLEAAKWEEALNGKSTD